MCKPGYLGGSHCLSDLLNLIQVHPTHKFRDPTKARGWKNLVPHTSLAESIAYQSQIDFKEPLIKMEWLPIDYRNEAINRLCCGHLCKGESSLTYLQWNQTELQTQTKCNSYQIRSHLLTQFCNAAIRAKVKCGAPWACRERKIP